MTISRMQQPRQLYGLGNLVKKITKPIKKIIKSPLGKAALLGAAAFGIPGTSVGGLFGRASFMTPGGLGVQGLLGKTGIQAALPSLFGVAEGSPGTGKPGLFGKIFDKIGTGGKIGLGGAFASYLFSEGKSEEEIEAITQNKDVLRGYLRDYYTKLNPDAGNEEVEEFIEVNTREYDATGGRVGFNSGGPGIPKNMTVEDAIKTFKLSNDRDPKNMQEVIDFFKNRTLSAKGGMPTGIMRTNPAGIMERDYRDEGGFVPVGIKEKADDVPAMLSKNEFVMTADAVRGAGDGSIEKGAQRMYDQMKKLENKVA